MKLQAAVAVLPFAPKFHTRNVHQEPFLLALCPSDSHCTTAVSAIRKEAEVCAFVHLNKGRSGGGR